ncbi:hypothetical protein CSA17_01825 [bacterium DOLJORAL78_65_58]|nr:MAG: hypothetical protein CSB20_10205 [bacterium DOLZORAL124_64_63]PIE76523.1 MAG: hypothetical protein CSA17_01825 [bacterium DOLJORAL78_65_58]
MVLAALEFEGDLVIAGSFTHVGDTPAAHVARFDGTAWSSFDDGLPAEATAAIVYDGALYVAGEFDGSYLARWNGNAWEMSPHGGEFNFVQDLEVYDGQLIVIADEALLAWNGSYWSELASLDESYPTDMTTDGANLYITGEMDYIDEVYVSHVARWDGNQWHAMGSGLSDEYGQPYEAAGLTIHAWDGKVAVSGYFSMAGGQNLPNFAVWDGTSWGPMGSNPSFFSGPAAPMILGVHAGRLLVYNGYSSVFAWNVFYWDPIALDGGVLCAASYGSDLVLGGLFSEAEGTVARNLARRSGGVWQAMASGDGIDGPTYAAHVWNDLLLVAGRPSTRFGDDVKGVLLAGWNGTDWVDMGLGPQSFTTARIHHMVTYQGDLVVTGNIDNAGGVPCKNFARYDGNTWTPLGDAVTNTSGAGLVVLDDTLYAITYLPDKVVARYQPDSDTWLEIGDSPGGTDLYALGSYQGQLIVTGSFQSIDGVAANGIAAWDGNTWSALGAGVEGMARELYEADGLLYVAGSITQAGGQPAGRIAAWDGTGWSTLGEGVYGSIRALRQHAGRLYATGQFSQAGGQPAAGIANWDGSTWSALGSGLNDEGLELVVHAGDLIVVGDFTVAGGHFSDGIASWTEAQPTGVGDDPRPRSTARLRLKPAYPNPFQHGTTFAFEMPRSGDAVLDVMDVRGRRVARRVATGLEPGPQVLGWDGRVRSGQAAPAGMYFVRLRAAGAEAVRKISLVR